MNTYGLTLNICEALIWSIRQEPSLWNMSWGHNGTKGDGCCCVFGVFYRHHSYKEDMIRIRIGNFYNLEHGKGVLRFAEEWFYDIASKFGVDTTSEKTSINARNLTLGKLKKIHAHLLQAAESRFEACGWTPPVREVVPDRQGGTTGRAVLA